MTSLISLFIQKKKSLSSRQSFKSVSKPPHYKLLFRFRSEEYKERICANYTAFCKTLGGSVRFSVCMIGVNAWHTGWGSPTHMFLYCNMSILP